jgi:hypothetical protein
MMKTRAELKAEYENIRQAAGAEHRQLTDGECLRLEVLLRAIGRCYLIERDDVPRRRVVRAALIEARRLKAPH